MASVNEKIGAFGLARSRIKLGHRRFVGMEHRCRQQLGAQGVEQRLQGQTRPAHPLGQRGAGQRDAVAREDRLLAIQRQVINVLLHHDLGQQARRGQAAVDDGRGDRLGHDGFAGAAGVLRIHIAAHEEHQRFDVQFFAGVLADLHQRRTAGDAVATIRLVDGRHALQLGWQSTPLRLGAWRLGCRRGAVSLRGFQRGLHGCDVLGHRLVKQSALHRIHALGLGGKLHPAQSL
jgi:hypothetical protein